jgi:Glyoxalase/Bleomycin resistance protein/Dioxygenase superfamily
VHREAVQFVDHHEPGRPAHPDKPDISVVDYQPGDTTSIFLNLRVADIQACYEEWKAKGAQFVTPPIDRGAEIRCYMRDPDGYLIEVGQATGVLHGELRSITAGTASPLPWFFASGVQDQRRGDALAGCQVIQESGQEPQGVQGPFGQGASECHPMASVIFGGCVKPEHILVHRLPVYGR